MASALQELHYLQLVPKPATTTTKFKHLKCMRYGLIKGLIGNYMCFDIKRYGRGVMALNRCLRSAMTFIQSHAIGDDYCEGPTCRMTLIWHILSTGLVPYVPFTNQSVRSVSSAICNANNDWLRSGDWHSATVNDPITQKLYEKIAESSREKDTAI